VVIALTLHVLHDEVGAALAGCHAAVEHLRHVGVVHDRQRLPLLLEAGEHGLGVHAGLDDLRATRWTIGSRRSASQTVPKPPSPISLQQLVGADEVALVFNLDSGPRERDCIVGGAHGV
jgi:hypothetical protein